MKIKYFKRYLALCLSTSFLALPYTCAGEKLLSNKTTRYNTESKKTKVKKNKKRVAGLPKYIVKKSKTGFIINRPEVLLDAFKMWSDSNSEVQLVDRERLLPGKDLYPCFIVSLLKVNGQRQHSVKQHLSFVTSYGGGSNLVLEADLNTLKRFLDDTDDMTVRLKRDLEDLFNSCYYDDDNVAWKGELLAYIAVYLSNGYSSRNRAVIPDNLKKQGLSRLCKLYNKTPDQIDSMLDPLIQRLSWDSLSKAYKNFYTNVTQTIKKYDKFEAPSLISQEEFKNNIINLEENDQETENKFEMCDKCHWFNTWDRLRCDYCGNILLDLSSNDLVNDANAYGIESNNEHENENLPSYVEQNANDDDSMYDYSVGMCNCGRINLGWQIRCSGCGSEF